MADKCKHENFDAKVTVNRILQAEQNDPIRYQADVEISCRDCGEPFRFVGLPAGVDLNGASVSPDGTEGRFAVAPRNEVWTTLEGEASGFTVRRKA